LPQFADYMSHDLNSCYLNALNVYLMLPFAIFMSEAKEKAKEFRSKYKVTLLKEIERKKLTQKFKDFFFSLLLHKYPNGPTSLLL
jgi:hypothetical protein